MHRLQPNQRDFARALRSNATDAERALWRRLRDRQVHGERFRRQHPLGPYVLDFACIARQLAVEVDGGQHAQSMHDAARDEWLRQQGWKVLRFWNHEVLGHVEGVLSVIESALAAPPPRPSPREGEGA